MEGYYMGMAQLATLRAKQKDKTNDQYHNKSNQG